MTVEMHEGTGNALQGKTKFFIADILDPSKFNGRHQETTRGEFQPFMVVCFDKVSGLLVDATEKNNIIYACRREEVN